MSELARLGRVGCIIWAMPPKKEVITWFAESSKLPVAD